MSDLLKMKDQLVDALNDHPFDDEFIEPLFAMFQAQSAPTYNMAMIVQSAKEIIPRSAFPPEMDPTAIGMIQHFFSLRYFAFRRFNRTSGHRFLTNASIEAGKDDDLARIILTSDFIEGPDDEHGVQFDHEELEAKIRALVEGNEDSNKGADERQR